MTVIQKQPILQLPRSQWQITREANDALASSATLPGYVSIAAKLELGHTQQQIFSPSGAPSTTDRDHPTSGYRWQRTEPRPCLGELAPLLELIGATVGLLHFAADLVRQGQLDDFGRERGLFGRPIGKRRAETVRRYVRPDPLRHAEHRPDID